MTMFLEKTLVQIIVYCLLFKTDNFQWIKRYINVVHFPLILGLVEKQKKNKQSSIVSPEKLRERKKKTVCTYKLYKALQN